MRRELRGVEEHGHPRSCAASTISSIGGIQPVTFDAPVIASSLRDGVGVERRHDVVDGERAVAAHSTNRVRATRAHGSRLAWCSTTVVTTTSSASKRSRYARWLIASVVFGR